MKIVRMCATILLSVLLFEGAIVAQTATNSKKLDLNLEITESVTCSGTVQIVHALSKKYGFPVGIEVSSAEAKSERVTVTFEKKSLREVLNSLIERDGRYRWEVNDDVVNIIPLERNQISEAFLELRVSRFEPQKSTKGDLNAYIGRLTEVNSLLEPMNVAVFAFDPPGVVDLEEICSLKMQSASIRSILNRIVVCNRTSSSWSVELVGDRILSVSF